MGARLTWNDGPISKSLGFDIVREEEQTLAATATDNPVESGVNVADHVRQELDRLSLTARVSNTPIIGDGRSGFVGSAVLDVPRYQAPFVPTPGAIFAAAGNALRSVLSSGVSAPAAATVLQFPAEFDAIKDTLETLETIKKSAQLVTVYLPSRVYHDMLLEVINVSRDGKSGSSAVFKLDFKQIRKVEAKIVTAPIPTEVRGASKKSKGSQGTKETDAKQKRSVAKSLANGLPDSVKKPFGLK